MYKLFLILLFITFQSYGQISTPRGEYPGLFESVQLSALFPDGKTFPDMIPLQRPKVIMKAYFNAKDKENFNLKTFITHYFRLPGSSTYTALPDSSIRHHIDTLWTVLYRTPEKSAAYTSLIPLPRPYLVPGGRFREVYYWDSYFTMLGLQESHKTTLMRSMTDNFAYLIRQYGFIPNGNRTYYLSRSQPPFFSMMVQLLAEQDGEMTYLNYLDALTKEYQFWMKGTEETKPGTANRHLVKLKDGSVLNRYWDASDQPREESYREDVLAAKLSKQKPADFYRNIRSAAESGWDFSSRWFEDGKNLHTIITTDLLAVDLNALLYHLELSIAKGYQLRGELATAGQYRQKAATRKLAMQKYFWDNQQGWFVDYNWKTERKSQMKTLAGLYPLFFDLAGKAEAKKIAAVTRKDFLKSSGLITTLSKTGQQWDAPNAWAPLQWIGIKGLRKYGYVSLSDTIAHRWINLNLSVFKKTGKLMEKYNVVDKDVKAGGGEYPSQDGFGWTNGVLLKLMNRYKDRR